MTMAVRKETVKKQFLEAMPSMLESGEQMQAGVYAVSGPNPFLAQGLFGLVGMLLFGVRWYFVAVTERRVLFIKASMMSGRPNGLAWADPRAGVTLSDVDLTASVWGHFRYTSPSHPKPLRMNVHRWWLDEGREVAGALGAPATA
jgi:hypothetical protein